MAQAPRLRLSGIVLGAPDAQSLARFYARLLGWQFEADEPGWAKLANPDGGGGLSFQTEEGHIAPVWPAGPGDQQMMVHLDFGVLDLEVGHEHAIASGASLAAYQPQSDVRVYFDPAGHPFCLFQDS